MPVDTNLNQIPADELAQKVHDDLIPLSGKVGYFFAGLPLSDDDVQEYLREPFAALPPSVVAVLPPLAMIMVPFLKRSGSRGNGKSAAPDLVCFDEPAERERIWCTRVDHAVGSSLLFALREQDVAEYHYHLYRLLAGLVIEKCDAPAREDYFGMLSGELKAGVHGEVDEGSWQLKQGLLRRKKTADPKTKGFEDYARQSMLDTMTLYLHGICCDIDVETGPRQVASRHLRKRLELLYDAFPPPEGYAVFPEQLKQNGSRD